ncbi:hypothetical protein A8C56_15330 [Niabella ginsenosidivorans]|uniref:DUF218 domain-containing protein n=1 Tax=Niabella ginsenosidivorans TaxID=1176587 RepID=A0A1A9I9E5_9BACT|nr:hypothetical protein A8C56_15330 [Niabella ginsenosidivorans]
MAALGIVLILIFLSGCAFVYRKRPARLYETVLARKQTFDAAIVPGVPFNNNQWDTVMKGRVIWASLLYRQGVIRNIIFSGGAVYSPYYEAKIMGLYARQLGVSPKHIFYDIQAEHSTENIFYSYQIARREGFKSIALVTDPLQSLLLNRFTRRKFRTKIVHIPFIIDSLKEYNHLNPVIDPLPAMTENFRSLTDREGFFRRFRGTMGAFIPWEGKRKKEGPL